MKQSWDLIRLVIFIFFFPVMLAVSPSWGKELPKIAVWDLEALNIPVPYAKVLTSNIVSEITKLKKYEVYSQENVRTLAGWTAEKMKLGCTDTKCLTALGQMDIARLISGSVGKIGSRYSISLNLFDTEKSRAGNAISDLCQTEDELIELLQSAVRKLLEEPSEARPSKDEQRISADRQRIRNDLERLAAEEKLAELRFNRSKELERNRLISLNELREAEAQLAVIRAEKKKKEEELQRSPR